MSKLESEINEILGRSQDSQDANTEYHKGGTCPFKDSFLFCQEGACSGCLVYAVWKEKNKPSWGV